MYPRLYIYIYIALCVICLSVTFRIKTEEERKLSFFRVVHRSRIGGNDSAMENKMFTLLLVPMSSIRCENLKGGRNGGQTKRENIRKFGMGRLEITKDEKWESAGRSVEGMRRGRRRVGANSVRATNEGNSCNKRGWTRANYFYRLGPPFDPPGPKK